MADKGGKRKKQIDAEEKVEPEVLQLAKFRINPRTRNARAARPEVLSNEKHRFKSIVTENTDLHKTGSGLDKSIRDRALAERKSSVKMREPSLDFGAKKLKCSSPSVQQPKSSTSLSIPSPRRLRSNSS